MKHYSGDYAQQVVFPLSGIGCGGLGISGIGALVDWELNGKANKCSVNEYSHFAIKAERNGKTVDARILQGDLTYALSGDPNASHHHSWGYGQGLNRTTMSGIAHCEDVDFCGEFPFAKINYKDKRMPADVSLRAFNPFIPLDEDNSSLPLVYFDFEITNPTDETTDYTIGFSCGNPFRINDGGYNQYFSENNYRGIYLSSKNYKKDTKDYGELIVATDCDNMSYQEYWFRGAWFDDITVFWNDFSSFGPLKNRIYNDNDGRGKLDIGDMCTISGKVTLQPGEKSTIGFVLCWYFPVFEKYWEEEKYYWKHEYCRRFADSMQILKYGFDKKQELLNKSFDFSVSLCDSTLPEACKEAAVDNLSVLKSPTCLRLENGEFWAFEGTGATTGSCEGTCDHVWMYQYALPFLFPGFARQIIETDLAYNLKPSGELMFRTMVPLGSEILNFRACVDGQMGLIMRYYREWKFSGNDCWMKKYWPTIKKVLEYAWNKDNRDLWDPDKTGVISGRQHHTLDVELFGKNSWLTGYYLCALKACAEIAEYLGENEKAEEYRSVFEKGKATVENELFNGEYYIQSIDIKDKAVIERFLPYDDNIYFQYWDNEKEELKYQYSSGCEIDQIIGQWHAGLMGLGDIFDKENRKKALKYLFKNNFVSMRDVFNPCRIFATNDEKGLLICNWENQQIKPRIPIPYSEECMTGFEYAAAGLMLSEGLSEQGLTVIEAIRNRYDGKKRNPFAEIECGSSYARSMASFSLFATFSGFCYDMSEGIIGFTFPKNLNTNSENKYFWSVDSSWGTVSLSDNRKQLKLVVKDGELSLNGFILPDSFKFEKVVINSRNTSYFKKENRILFSEKESIKELTIY